MPFIIIDADYKNKNVKTASSFTSLSFIEFMQKERNGGYLGTLAAMEDAIGPAEDLNGFIDLHPRFPTKEDAIYYAELFNTLYKPAISYSIKEI